MSSDQGKSSILKSITNLGTLGWKALEWLYAAFTKLWTPVQIALAAAGLLLAFYYGKALLGSLLVSETSVAAALGAKIEPTRNSDQGITAILLSGVPDEWTKPELLNVSEVTTALEAIDKRIRELSSAQSMQSPQGSQQQTTATAREAAASTPQAAPTTLELINKLELTVKNAGSTVPWQTAITSRRPGAFTVVPATSLRRKTLNEAPLAPDDQAQLAAVLEYNPEILFDLNLEAEIEPIMQRFDYASGEKLTVIQTYFITESGTFLIRAAGVKDQRTYYESEFLPYNQYMDRPYFWGAVDIKPGQRKLTPFDYGTKPYLDLGGHGIVVTFSKKFELPNQRVGVLCVDAKLPDYVTDEIKDNLKSLGASVSDFYWSGSKGVESGEADPLPKEFSWFDVQLNKSREAKSQVLGSIATEPTPATPRQSRDGSSNVVRFTVPVSSREDSAGQRKTRLLWVEFNAADILKTLTKNLILFTAGIILVIAVTWSLFWDYTVLKREMSKVLKHMSNVLRDAATPFVWLDEKNEFVDMNNSMLVLLGYNNIEELRTHCRQFRGLVTAQTQKTYDAVLENSAAGQETGEYEIDVITKSGTVLHVRAHGERIPYPTLWRRGLPHRFGIFVKVIEGVAGTELVNPKRTTKGALGLNA